jgi:hypothetical protein
MLSFIEASLAEAIVTSLRDLAADAIPSASAVGVVVAIGAVLFAWTRRARRSGRRRPLPAAA